MLEMDWVVEQVVEAAPTEVVGEVWVQVEREDPPETERY